MIDIPAYVSDDEMDANEAVNSEANITMKKKQRYRIKETVFSNSKEAVKVSCKGEPHMYKLKIDPKLPCLVIKHTVTILLNTG